MFPKRSIGPRQQHRADEAQRVNDAPTLATKFPALKSLVVDLRFADAKGVNLNGHIKYKLNVEAAKAVLRFSCPNGECIRGDFDLSNKLADAVKEKEDLVTGEMPCGGWLSKATIDTVRCTNVLRYRLNLTY